MNILAGLMRKHLPDLPTKSPLYEDWKANTADLTEPLRAEFEAQLDGKSTIPVSDAPTGRTKRRRNPPGGVRGAFSGRGGGNPPRNHARTMLDPDPDPDPDPCPDPDPEEGGLPPAPAARATPTSLSDPGPPRALAGTDDHPRCHPPCVRVCVSEKQHRLLAARFGGRSSTPRGSSTCSTPPVRARLPDDQPIGERPWEFWDNQFRAAFGTGPSTPALGVTAAAGPRSMGPD